MIWKASQIIVFVFFFWLLRSGMGEQLAADGHGNATMASAIMALVFTVLVFAPIMWIQVWRRRRSLTQAPRTKSRLQRH